MKKSAKILSFVLVISLVAVLFASCGASAEDIIGTWESTYEYNGNIFNVVIVFNSNGTYAQVSYKNGAFNKTEGGDYEISGSKVTLYDSSASVEHGISRTLTYKNGTLSNSTYTLTKSE